MNSIIDETLITPLGGGTGRSGEGRMLPLHPVCEVTQRPEQGRGMPWNENHSVGAENLTRVLWKNSQGSLLLSHPETSLVQTCTQG